jgi:hypothetical protein
VRRMQGAVVIVIGFFCQKLYENSDGNEGAFNVGVVRFETG